MPVVEFVESSAGPATRAEASGPLVDVCDEAHAAVEFSCRTANCGTCRVVVLAGADLLEPPRADELGVLAEHASGPDHRLACQAVVRDAPGLLRLRWIGR